MKSVQIPYDMFVDLVLYHLNGEDDFDEEIRQGLEQKLDAILNRQLYSQYKTAPTEEEREQAKQEYPRGVLPLLQGSGQLSPAEHHQRSTLSGERASDRRQ